MTNQVLRFEQLPWQSLSDVAKQKLIQLDGKQARLLELDSGFKEEDWCQRGHIGYVIAGTIKIEFQEEVKTYAAGDGLFVPDGVKHKAMTVGETVRLFLVDEL